MSKTFIKFCGVTSIDDYFFINNQDDVSFIGMIFTHKSPRCLTISQANKILKSTMRNKKVVGVFMDQSHESIQNIIDNVNLDILQFHGDENLKFCEQFNKPFIKTLHVKNDSLKFGISFKNKTDYFLLDTSLHDNSGGTGKQFDWDLLSTNSLSNIIHNTPFFVAGGLNSDNIGNLISKHKPYGIDVSSGLESEVGKKDHLLMKKFLENVRIAEKEYHEEN
tara:strand:- start:1060 stop:1722 length:663 start_codon:yes stop_codon:yes gene_type:complete